MNKNEDSNQEGRHGRKRHYHRLKDARIGLKLTQAKLAEELNRQWNGDTPLNLDKFAISKMENGKRPITGELLEIWAPTVGISYNFLFLGYDEKSVLDGKSPMHLEPQYWEMFVELGSEARQFIYQNIASLHKLLRTKKK